VILSCKTVQSKGVELNFSLKIFPSDDRIRQKGFFHGYTYSGHPLACTTSLAVIDYYYKEKLAERAAKTGEYLMGELRGIQERQPIIGDIRGLGLFIGVELVSNLETKEELQPTDLKPEQSSDPDLNPMYYLVQKAKSEGLIVGKSFGHSIMRIVPALIISKEQIDEGLKILESSLEDTIQKFDLPKKQ